MKTVYMGIDLSGPANSSDTAVCWFDGDQLQIKSNCDDNDILNIVSQYRNSQKIYIAIDSPLSYQMHGGYRDVDKALRALLNKHQYHHIGVMSPTMTKMVYLTLRGIRLSSFLTKLNNVSLYETHPGASLVMSGHSYDLVKSVKKSPSALEKLNHALFENFVRDIKADDDHQLMAFAAMLSARRVANGDSLFSFQSNILLQPQFVL